jgi:hypothetical protein
LFSCEVTKYIETQEPPPISVEYCGVEKIVVSGFKQSTNEETSNWKIILEYTTAGHSAGEHIEQENVREVKYGADGEYDLSGEFEEGIDVCDVYGSSSMLRVYVNDYESKILSLEVEYW